MDIALKAKRAIASLSAGFIALSAFVFSGGTALADTFLDVTPDMWSYNYVEQGVDDGYFDAGVKFRPFDGFNRAELVKTVCVITDCLAGYKAPATPTFKDVAPGVWYYDYVESLAAQGVVNGYTNAQGVPTGQFGPGNVVLRNEFVKLAVLAFDIPETLTPANQFKDVVNGTWYEPYFTTAYNQSVIDGYTNAQGDLTGYAGPGDPLTREQAAKVLYTGQNYKLRAQACDPNTDPNCKDGVCPADDPTDPDCLPLNCDPNDPNDPDCLPPTTSNGDLEVSLNANTPKGTTLALGATHVELASFDFTAVGDDVTLTSLTIDRGGVGTADDIDELYLYEGAVRQTNGRSINSDNQAKFPLKFVIKAGQTRTLTVVGDITTTAGINDEHAFSIAAAESVTHNGKNTKGNFALTGQTFSIGGKAVNTVVIKPGPDPSDAQLGEVQAELGTVRMEVGSDADVWVKSLAFNNAGSFDPQNVTNLTLKIGDEVVAKADAIVNDIVTFDLGDKPYLLKSGQNKTAYILGDLVGGKDGETFIFYLENNVDAYIEDNDFNQGATIDNQFTFAQANTVNVIGGDFVLSDNGPTATQISNDSQNQPLLNVGMTPAQNVTVKDTQVAFTLKDNLNNVPLFDNGTEAVGAAPVLGAAPCNANEYKILVASTANFTAGDMFLLGNASGRVTSFVLNTSICAVSADALAAGTMTEVNPYSYLTDPELIDLDSQGTLAGGTGLVSAGTLCTGPGAPVAVCPAAGSYAVDLDDDYDLETGKTLHTSVQVDIEPEMVIGYLLNARMDFDANSIKNVDSNQFLATEDIIGIPLDGDSMIITENDLGVAASAAPNSQNFVKGAKAQGLGFTLSAGDTGDVKVTRIKVRAYGCDNTDDTPGPNTTVGVQCFEDTTGADVLGHPEAWENALGNVAANGLISTITLYKNGQVVGTPKSIKLVDANNNGYTAGTDYYEADFDNLSLVIPESETVSLVAEVQLQNTINGIFHFALDVNPADITAQDNEGDDVIPTGDLINGDFVKVPMMTIGAAGTLTAAFEGSPDASILVMGTNDNAVSRFRFAASDEDFLVDRLTIMNDVAGDFGTPVNSPAIGMVTIKYKDKNNVEKTKTAALQNPGIATFSGLDIWVPADGQTYVDVLANISNTNVQTLSGLPVRLGLQNLNNTINTFEAIGQGSSLNENFSDGNEVSNVNDPELNIVRRSKPIVSNAPNATSVSDGTVSIYDFNVKADPKAPITVGRIVYDVTITGNAGTTLGAFKIYKNGSVIDDVKSNIRTSGGVDITETGLGTITVGANKVIVSFNEEQTITAGATALFSLRATAAGFTVDESVSTKPAIGDENAPVTGIIGDGVSGCTNDPAPASNGNGNTAHLSDVAGGAGCALFTAAVTDFRQLEPATHDRNFLWNDLSYTNPFHTYPTVVLGSVTDGTGTADWTNGHLLDITNLNPATLKN